MVSERRQVRAAAIAPLALAAAALAAAAGGGCGEGDTTSNPRYEARAAVAAGIVVDAVIPTLERFGAHAESLELAGEAWAAEPADDDRRAAMQVAWAEALQVWQQAEVMQFGPTGARGSVAGGADLRDEVYSWPVTNHCRIDQELVDEQYLDPVAFAEEPVNVRGLDAMEYLLFVDGTENDCEPQSRINREGTWSALGADEIRARRTEYAHALSALVAASAQSLVDVWRSDGGNFLAELQDPGGVFPTGQAALNAVSDALFYLDKETKDMKLAEPAGLSSASCPEPPPEGVAGCPAALELPLSGETRNAVASNLRGARWILHGGDPEAPSQVGPGGFLGLLREVGAEDVATRLDVAILDAIDIVERSDVSYREVLVAGDAQPIIDAHTALRGVTDIMKTELVGVLDLELPARAEGDND